MVYIACEEVNFIWKPSEVVEFDRLWNEENKHDIRELAAHFKRPCRDIAFLIYDRNEKFFAQFEGDTRSKGYKKKVKL